MVALAVLGLSCGSEETTPAAEPLGPGEVTFTTIDGVDLRGRHFGDGEVTVVLAHMFPADQESWKPFAETLAAEGYAAFTFNFRGYAPSSGTREIERIGADLQGALAYLEGMGASKVFLVGASMGGTAAVRVATQRAVLGVVGVSAPTTFRGLDALPPGTEPRSPVLFLAAEDDRAAQQSAAALYDASSAPRLLEVYTGAEHGTDLVYGQHAALVQRRILEFLTANSP